jgi:hypothetical protein
MTRERKTCNSCRYLNTNDRQLSARQWAVWYECGNASIPQRGRIDPETFYCAQHAPRPTEARDGA